MKSKKQIEAFLKSKEDQLEMERYKDVDDVFDIGDIHAQIMIESVLEGEVVALKWVLSK
jgi:hypothetical protein